MAQGVAWAAREAGVRATIVAPDTAPRAKLDAVERLGGEVIRVPHEVWWQTMVDRRLRRRRRPLRPPGRGRGGDGRQRHDRARALRGARRGLRHGVVPWGGGGLTTGIASAVKALRPGVRVVTAEPETAAPLAASLRRRRADGDRLRPSFVDGAGGRALLPTMWEHARELVDEAVAVPLDDVAEAVRLLASRARVVAEGAGALAARRRAAPRGPDRVHRERRQHRRRSARTGARGPDSLS